MHACLKITIFFSIAFVDLNVVSWLKILITFKEQTKKSNLEGNNLVLLLFFIKFERQSTLSYTYLNNSCKLNIFAALKYTVTDGSHQ